MVAVTTNVLVILITVVVTDGGVAVEVAAVVEEEEAVDMVVGAGCRVRFPEKRNWRDSSISHHCIDSCSFPISCGLNCVLCVSLAGMVEHREDALPPQVEMAKQVLTRLGDFSAMSDDDDDLVSNIRALANLLVSIGTSRHCVLTHTPPIDFH